MAEIFKHAFPESIVYLDNAASTRPHPVLLEDIETFWDGAFYNPSAANPCARILKKNIQAREKQFLAALGAENDVLLWTSGGTEANNLAIQGTIRGPGNHIVTTTAEHPSIHAPCQKVEAGGATVSHIPVGPNGKIDLDRLVRALTPSTRLVTLAQVQSETGAIQNLVAVRETMDKHAPKALLHVDGVQGLTKCAVPWQEARIDMISFSGHKIHAFGGVGALLTRKGVEIMPMIVGGGQQNSLRQGSLDCGGILSFLTAWEALHRDNDFIPRIRRLNARIREQLGCLTGRDGNPVKHRILSQEDGSPFILSISFPGYEGAVLMRILASMGVIVSTGSACSAENTGPSKVLTAMGFSREVAYGVLRISFGYENTDEHIDRFVTCLQEALRSY